MATHHHTQNLGCDPLPSEARSGYGASAPTVQTHRGWTLIPVGVSFMATSPTGSLVFRSRDLPAIKSLAAWHDFIDLAEERS